jgi:RNA polymerase sigma-70 factor (ECF subfamily)
MKADAQASGQVLERFRDYLSLLARLHMDPRLQGKIDLSGVVQQTLLDTHKAFGQFQRLPPDEQAAWLRRVLANNLKDEVRKLSAAVRNVGREISLEAALENSSVHLEAWLAQELSSPSQQAIRSEELLRLAQALAQLPEDQRRAVELHHLSGMPVAEVSAHMGRSPGAVGALLVRGLKKLRLLMRDPE